MAKASGPTSPTRGRHKKQEDLQFCSLQKQEHKHSKFEKKETTKKYVADTRAR